MEGTWLGLSDPCGGGILMSGRTDKSERVETGENLFLQSFRGIGVLEGYGKRSFVERGGGKKKRASSLISP